MVQGRKKKLNLFYVDLGWCILICFYFGLDSRLEIRCLLKLVPTKEIVKPITFPYIGDVPGRVTLS